MHAQPPQPSRGPAEGLAAPPLSDGEWHRLHPLTPLFRGGLFLVIVAGVVIEMSLGLLHLVTVYFLWRNNLKHN